MKRLKKTLKLLAYLVIAAFLILYLVFIYFSQPKSDDKLLASFKGTMTEPTIFKKTFQGSTYRVLAMQKEIDTLLPTMVFVHGTPGSSSDFKAYLSDSTLNARANLLAYDRVGYNYKDSSSTQASIAFERDLLINLLGELPQKNTVVVGYSYGGPVALSLQIPLKKIVLLAPAVYSKEELVPWPIKFYQWKLTRWLVPHIWKMASLEKLTHGEDLKTFENNWTLNPNSIVCIQGDSDQIVPYGNSLALKKQFPKAQVQLKTIVEAGHGLIWSEFESIKEQLLKSID
ncbi:hypothetical protein GCM10011416_22550 [Polaribacter pacificus]|uniref:AB hydrolase-1 domain-containing protein n=1 Tax=Polaribacter pacificus TaxID=1775173 RepID=A0A917MF91_9FLAO|nr:alpha/beta hydrolase [Polaribacter pacificus]GGH03141.1 hypothetical protein GCM10011416_22550 [Polaribacter pacificus]